MTVRQRVAEAPPAMKFVVTVGIMSFFADFTYEGSRSITGPYLGLLGAGAFAISVISGAGEFLGYNIRLFSGRGADRTGRYWPITIGGYVLQMSVVPLLALAGTWQLAALLIIAERIGKGIRNPPRDAMLSHAAKDIGYGRAFGVHEALDQFAAVIGRWDVEPDDLATDERRRFGQAASAAPMIATSGASIDAYPSDLSDLFALQPRVRALPYMVEVEGQQIAPAAEAVGMSSANARVALLRARPRLRATPYRTLAWLSRFVPRLGYR